MAELKQNGTYRPSRHGERAAEEAREASVVSHAPVSRGPDKELPPAPLACPHELAGVAALWWATLAAALVGRVLPSDAPLLSRACCWLAEGQRCEDALADLKPGDAEYGRVLRSAAAASAAADRILSQFGLSPAARAKLPPVFAEGAPGVVSKPRTGVRPPTPLDIATERWHALGHSGNPTGDPVFERLYDEEKARADVSLTPEEREKRRQREAEMEAHRREHGDIDTRRWYRRNKPGA